jgi:hypothetical protein
VEVVRPELGRVRRLEHLEVVRPVDGDRGAGEHRRRRGERAVVGVALDQRRAVGGVERDRGVGAGARAGRRHRRRVDAVAGDRVERVDVDVARRKDVADHDRGVGDRRRRRGGLVGLELARQHLRCGLVAAERFVAPAPDDDQRHDDATHERGHTHGSPHTTDRNLDPMGRRLDPLINE